MCSAASRAATWQQSCSAASASANMRTKCDAVHQCGWWNTWTHVSARKSESGWAQLAQISFRVALLYLAVSQFEITLWLVIYWHYLQHADILNHHSPNHPLPILKQHWYDMRPAMQGSETCTAQCHNIFLSLHRTFDISSIQKLQQTKTFMAQSTHSL